MKRVRRRAAAPEATTTPPPDAAPQISGEAPIGEGATVAGVTAAPKEGSNPSASATRASRLPKAPSGPIQTLAPGGGSFGIDWSAINPYDELVAQACDAFRVPFGRLKAVIPIESRGDRHAVQKNDRNGWSYGLVQVVPYGNGWDRAAAIAKIAGLGSNYTREQVITALYDPAINLRVGASILAGFYATHQDWDAANSSFFIGKPGWGSGDTVNGTTGQQYKQSLDGLLAEIWAADRQTARGEGSHTFGMPAWPKGFDRRILKKPPSGNGWDALGSRSAGMAGAAVHCTDGYDNRDAIWQLFSIGGARAYDAATDAVIDRAGLGYLLLDPWSVDPLEGSGMTPWASGGNQATGPGVAFLQKLGAYANNKYLFSTEHCNRATDWQRFTDPQMDLSAKVYAVVITREGIQWDSWPINQKHGLYVALKHRDFTTQKSCPGPVWAQPFHNAWVQAVAAEAKVLQTGTAPSVPVPIPDPEPPPDPQTFTAFGMGLEQISHYFGTLTRYNLDGTTTELTFNPDGVLSKLWLDRFAAHGVFPEAEEMRAFDSKLAEGKEWFATWEGGYTAWLPVDNNRAFWRWLDVDGTEAPIG